MVPIQAAGGETGQPIDQWLVLGPFVVRTGSDFEREYLYEREHILDIDYLAADGGESLVQPEAGRVHDNPGLGPKTLAWREHCGLDLIGVRLAGEIIYATVQRNCVFYAAAEVISESACLALLDARHSGMKAWVNGALVYNEPYGKTKGARLSQPSGLVRLRAGRNRLMIKFRPGYICDGLDFEVRQVTLSPLVSVKGCPLALGRIRPLPLFIGTVEKPRQLFEAALVNTGARTVEAEVRLRGARNKSGDSVRVSCPPRQVVRVRLSLPAGKHGGKPCTAIFHADVGDAGVAAPFAYVPAEAPSHAGTMMVLSSFHFDTTYHEEQRVYAMGAFDIVRQYCVLHRQDPNFRSIISEIDYLKPYFDVFPEDRQTLMEAFGEKRSESDVMYNQPNEQTCGSEALVRNFLYGQLFHGRVLGGQCSVYGPGDVFGHPNQLSQIARKSGCIGITWDKHIYNFPPFFEHLALDGIGLPHKRGHARWEDVHAMGLSVITGDIDQTPPTDWHADLLPEVRQATYGDLMTMIQQQCEEHGAHLPVTTRDMALYHAATALSRTDLKIANRLGENMLIAAEKFATLAAFMGARYPEKALDKGWRQLLCGQHHDSITGTHNEISFVDLMNAYRETLELGAEVVERSLDFLGTAIQAPKASHAITVFNSLAWERTDVVRATVKPRGVKGFALRDLHGNTIAFETTSLTRDKRGRIAQADIVFIAEKIPSLGYRTFELVETNNPLPVAHAAAGVSIENEFYRLTADPDRGGGLADLYDKKARRSVLQTGHHVGNELAVLEESGARDETQHEFYTTGLKMFSGERPAVMERLESPVRSVLRARYAMGELCGVVQEVILYRGIKRIEFHTYLQDVQGENYLFAVTFPTNLKGAAPVFDERFGVVTRNESRNYLDFRTHRMVMFSECAVYAANQWMEYGASAVLRIGASHYALGMIGLILPRDEALQSFGEALQAALIKKGVTCTPWFDDEGPYWGSYLPHRDLDRLYTRFRIAAGIRGNNAYAAALIGKQSPAVQKSFRKRLQRDGFAFLLVADAQCTEPDWPALPVLLLDAKSADALVEVFDLLMADFARSAEIVLPGEVDATGGRPVVDDYGIAILNQGTYANSIEKGGVICMMLAHTCAWYGGVNNFPEGYLVPEHKNHAYHYALYPHAGSWRDADTQRAGHAFNNPLLAREIKPGKNPFLPPDLAFLEVSPKNVILAAMKPFGNPIASFQKNADTDPANGIMLRLYDTEGVDTTAQIRFDSGILSAWSANLLEERSHELPIRQGSVSMYIAPFAIETVGFVPRSLYPSLPPKDLGPNAEPVQPVWTRSWEHDAESMPMGYAPVVCSLSRKIEEAENGNILVVTVNVVNDYTDAPVQGAAQVTVPDGWEVDTPMIPFDLPPLGHCSTSVRIWRPGQSAAGLIKLRCPWAGQVFQDVLEVNGPFEPILHAEHCGNEIRITVENPSPETLDAEVSLVSPIETWPARLTGRHALIEISPRTQGLSLAPASVQTVRFTVTARDDAPFDAPSYWAVAKLMCNGRIQLKRCDVHPLNRLMTADRYHEEFADRVAKYTNEKGRWWENARGI